jgi:hypothetical protein
LNTIKEPTPVEETPPDPTRKPFRRYLTACVLVVVVLTAARAGSDYSASGVEHDVWDRALRGLITSVSLVCTGSFLLMLFAPQRARRVGLPAVGGGDERERHVLNHGFAYGHTVGVVATVVYGLAADNNAVVGLSIAMQATAFLAMLWHNRKI